MSPSEKRERKKYNEIRISFFRFFFKFKKQNEQLLLLGLESATDI